MKKVLSLTVISMLLCMGFAMATSTSTGVGINLTPGNSQPNIWMDTSSRQLSDVFGNPLTRMNNYAFTGEKIFWNVLANDPNGVEDISSVDVTVGSNEGTGNPIEVSCTVSSQQPYNGQTMPWAGGLSFNPDTDRLYDCLLTVEPGFNQEYWVQASVMDDQGIQDTVREDSFFWFNPSIGLQVLNAPTGLNFGSVAPGQTGYSQTIKLQSIVASGSGVILDVDIAGNDFYDPTSSGAMCPTTNQLALSNFRYFATKGSYDTSNSGTADPEGYDTIPYLPNPVNIIRGSGSQASQLTEGTEFAITFKLNLPLPCSGNFVNGAINFEGKAI